MNLWVVFLTGISIGGITCLALQGGLLASVISAREEEDLQAQAKRTHTILPTLAFLSTKLTGYIILGFILGLFGKSFSFTDTGRAIIQLVAGLYMIAIALNLFNVHPIFRYVVIQPPKFLTLYVRKKSKSKDMFAPALLGLLTLVIPCGTTIAMETLAISSGNPFFGAAIMGVFILGTAPYFLGLGYLTAKLGDVFHERFLKIAAVALIYLGIVSINGTLNLINSPLTLETLWEAVPIEVNLNGTAENKESGGNSNAKIENGVQVADIAIEPYGYYPDYIRVEAGKPVKLNLKTAANLGCTSAFRIPQLGISKNLALNSSDSVEFTPQKPGKIRWTCSMGMYSGTLEVI